jgi:hypothetical protein
VNAPALPVRLGVRRGRRRDGDAADAVVSSSVQVLIAKRVHALSVAAITERGHWYEFTPPGRAVTVGMACDSDEEAIERAKAWCRRNCASGARYKRFRVGERAF